MSVEVREIYYNELPKLIGLYRQLNPEDPELAENNTLARAWDEIFNDPNMHYIVLKVDDELVATCNISIIRNLTRGLRPYAVIENVVTHSDYRKKGYGTQVLRRAIDIAKEHNCYKIMLMTGSKEEDTLRFYEKAGFNKGVKTGFIIHL